MKRGWDLGWKIGLVVGLLFAGLQWLEGQGAGIGGSLAGAGAIGIVFGIAGALIGGVWAAAFGRKPTVSPPSSDITTEPPVVISTAAGMKDGQSADQGGVRSMFLVWFFVFLAAYVVTVGVVMSSIDSDPDRAVAILRGAGFPGLIVAFVGAKLMTRHRYKTTPHGT